MQELRVLRKQRDALDDQIQRLEWQLSNAPLGAPRPAQLFDGVPAIRAAARSAGGAGLPWALRCLFEPGAASPSEGRSRCGLATSQPL